MEGELLSEFDCRVAYTRAEVALFLTHCCLFDHVNCYINKKHSLFLGLRHLVQFRAVK